MLFKKQTVVTTSWDDGDKCDLILKKLLDKYNLKGTFYITINYQNRLNNDDLCIIDQNHEIGAHTLNHPKLTEIPNKIAWDEIIDSKIYLEDILGHSVKIFSYPYGNYNDTIKDYVKKAGYFAARTVRNGDFYEAKDQFELPVTLQTSDGFSRINYHIKKKYSLPIRSLYDWEIRAKRLFDKVLEVGGVFHIWGHSWQIEEKNEWEKIERVFNYIANRKNVLYKTNSQIFLDYEK